MYCLFVIIVAMLTLLLWCVFVANTVVCLFLSFSCTAFHCSALVGASHSVLLLFSFPCFHLATAHSHLHMSLLACARVSLLFASDPTIS